ncbi:hypothetical protein PCE1_003280 [Barthelona sp. PCE]
MGIGSSLTTIEMFEFNDGEFKKLEVYELPFSFRGCVLNKRFAVNATQERSSTLEIIDFDERCHVIDRFETFYPVFDFLVQDGSVYVIYTSNYDIIAKVTFTHEGIPMFINEFPLKHINVFFLDRTPENNRFITACRGEICLCSVDEDGAVCYSSDPREYHISWGSRIEFAQVMGVIVPDPSAYEHFPDVYSEVWDFISLNGENYCSEYNEDSGSTIFYQLSKRMISCLFVLSSSFRNFTDEERSYAKFPVILDVLGNSATLLNPSPDLFGNDNVLVSVRRFYDLGSHEWRLGFVSNSKGVFYMYVGCDQINSFYNSQNNSEPLDVFFYNNHYISYFRDRDGGAVYLNNKKIGEHARFPKLVGNTVWYISSESTLTMHVLDQETSEIVITNEFEFDEIIHELIENPYCENQCYIRSFDECFIVNYTEENDTFKVLMIDNDKDYVPCFIDSGVIVCSDRVIYFSQGIYALREIPVNDGGLHSPRPGIAVSYKCEDDYKVKCSYYELIGETHSFSVTIQDIDIIKFLSQCNITQTFTSFGKF